jgi:hypothetical protein
MSTEAMKEALAILDSRDFWQDEYISKAADVLRQAIEKAEKREWFELTDEEIDDIENNVDPALYWHFAKAIEARLKEKNT